MYRQRDLAPTLRNALVGFPAVLVTGPRQSGKTTFLRHEAGADVEYVSFDDPIEHDFALVDPTGFLARFKDRRLILDEIQYVPSLLPHLKMSSLPMPAKSRCWPADRNSVKSSPTKKANTCG